MSTNRFEFDWDPAKAATYVVRHDVSFEDAMTVFADPLALTRADDGARDGGAVDYHRYEPCDKTAIGGTYPCRN